MLDLAGNKIHDESRQGEAVAPLAATLGNTISGFILKATAAR